MKVLSRFHPAWYFYPLRLLLLFSIAGSVFIDYITIYIVGFRQGDISDVIGFSIIFGGITLVTLLMAKTYWNGSDETQISRSS